MSGAGTRNGDGFDGYTNSESVSHAHDELHVQRAEQRLTTAEAEHVRTHVESADDPDTVRIVVGDETVSCEPMGALKRTRLVRDAIRAEERGTDLDEAEAILAIGEALIEHSDDEFDQRFWDDRSEGELRDAFQSLAQSSAGGDRAGE